MAQMKADVRGFVKQEIWFLFQFISAFKNVYKETLNFLLFQLLYS